MSTLINVVGSTMEQKILQNYMIMRKFSSWCSKFPSIVILILMGLKYRLQHFSFCLTLEVLLSLSQSLSKSESKISLEQRASAAAIVLEWYSTQRSCYGDLILMRIDCRRSGISYPPSIKTYLYSVAGTTALLGAILLEEYTRSLTNAYARDRISNIRAKPFRLIHYRTSERSFAHSSS